MKKFILALCLAGCAIGAQAQTLTISTESASSPGTQAVTINYEAGGDLANISVRLDFDENQLTPQTDAAANPNVDGCVSDLPPSHTGAFTACNNPTPGAIALTITDQFSGTVLPTTSVGSITFDVAAGLDPGTISPIQIMLLSATTDGGASISADMITLNDGSITIQVPAGQSAFSSDPVPGTEIDLGSAVVGTQTSPDETITVSNASTDTAFDILSAAGNFDAGSSGSYSVSSPAIPATVGADSEVDVDLNCTPGERGANTGTFFLTTDADNVTEAQYPTVCTGLAPNVQVPDGPVELSSTVAGADPAADITVSNPDDGFTSTANAVTATAGAGSPQITVTAGGPANIAPDESFDFTVECDTSEEGVYARTIDFEWDDPAGPGIDSIEVECTVSDTAPIFNSDPAPGETLALVTEANTESGLDGLDINNANPNDDGDALTITDATVSDPVFTVDLVNDSFDAGADADGIDDVVVSCTPPGVGTIEGTLTLKSNDPNEPAEGFTYTLSCEGTGDIVTTSPEIGGVLNLGTVAPGSTTGEGLISFTNNQIDGDVDVDCTVTDTAGVFTFPDPIDFTIAAGDTESAAFQCSPTGATSFSANVACNLPGRGASTFTVACAGRVLVVPTMSRWGLIVMSLVLLMVAGFAGRRMLA